ncbi:MAG: hypothetical protein QM831_12450 [Kofleriaceae bacterium]
MLLLAAAAALLSQTHAAAGSCAFLGMKGSVLTRRDTKVPADGGVLVSYGFGNDRELTPAGEDPSDVKFDTKSKLERTQLAPGLSVYKFSDKTLDLKKGGTFTHDGTAAAITVAPAPGKLTIKSEQSFRSMTTTAKMTLTAAPPAEAVGLIVYDDKGTALLFAGVPDTHDKLKEVALYTTGGHCGTPQPPNQGSMWNEGTYSFAYFDAFGRLGPKSKAVKL